MVEIPALTQNEFRGARQRIGTIFCALLLCIMVAKPALADDDFVPAPDMGTTTFDFDTPDEHFSQFSLKDVGTMNAVRAVMRIDRLGSSAVLPVLEIHIVASGEEFQVQLVAMNHSAPLSVKLIHYINHAAVAEQTLATTVDLRQALNVAINWTPDGTVIAKVEKEGPIKVKLSQPVVSVALSNSTGDGKFYPFRIGHSTDILSVPDPSPSPQ